ncbi:hypothetical protein DAI22_01g035908 [Oryza sativa Japonica Group]|nr:hypothetical protein DAI22_01g035908 [Oryza sativa Japonica Group]
MASRFLVLTIATPSNATAYSFYSSSLQAAPRRGRRGGGARAGGVEWAVADDDDDGFEEEEEDAHHLFLFPVPSIFAPPSLATSAAADGCPDGEPRATHGWPRRPNAALRTAIGSGAHSCGPTLCWAVRRRQRRREEGTIAPTSPSPAAPAPSLDGGCGLCYRCFLFSRAAAAESPAAVALVLSRRLLPTRRPASTCYNHRKAHSLLDRSLTRALPPGSRAVSTPPRRVAAAGMRRHWKPCSAPTRTMPNPNSSEESAPVTCSTELLRGASCP